MQGPDHEPADQDIEVSRRKVVAALLHRDRRFAQQAVPLAHAEQLASDFEALGYSVMNSQGFSPQYRQLIVWVSVGSSVPVLTPEAYAARAVREVGEDEDGGCGNAA